MADGEKDKLIDSVGLPNRTGGGAVHREQVSVTGGHRLSYVRLGPDIRGPCTPSFSHLRKDSSNSMSQLLKLVARERALEA